MKHNTNVHHKGGQNTDKFVHDAKNRPSGSGVSQSGEIVHDGQNVDKSTEQTIRLQIDKNDPKKKTVLVGNATEKDPEIGLDFTGDVRHVFHAGDSLSFRFADRSKPLYVVGENAVGKSTFADLVRLLRCDNPNERRGVDGNASLEYSFLYSGFNDKVKLRCGFSKVLHVSSTFDNPQSRSNSYDVGTYFDRMGYATHDKSHGQTTTVVFFSIVKKGILDVVGEGRTLLVLDEPEVGLDLPSQAVFFGGILNDLALDRNVAVLCFTHSAVALHFADEVFDFKTMKPVKADEYMRKSLVLPEREKK